jgi:hypothetical protein
LPYLKTVVANTAQPDDTYFHQYNASKTYAMRALVYIITILLIFILSGCEKSDNSPEINSIVNTEWILSKIIDNHTASFNSILCPISPRAYFILD